MIRIEIDGFTVTCPSLEVARDLLVLTSGAQRLVRVERGRRPRRVEVPESGPQTLDSIARKHTSPPVVLAPPSPPARLDVDQARAVEGKPPRRAKGSALRQHLEETEPEAPSAPQVDVRIPVSEPELESPPESEPVPPTEPSFREPPRAPVVVKLTTADKAIAAFRADPSYPLPLLAEQLYDTPGPRSETLLGLLLTRLVQDGKLERVGDRTWRVPGSKHAKAPKRKPRTFAITAPIDHELKRRASAGDEDDDDDPESERSSAAPEDFEDTSELDGLVD